MGGAMNRLKTLVMALLPGLLPVLLMALLPAGCGEQAHEANLDTSRPTDPSEFGYQVSPRTVNLMEGAQAYKTYCVGCHGPTGEGNGPASRWLYPPPRNFKKADFKFMSTRFGELPTDADLYRTITNGLRGSSMPSWGHLPERTRLALIEYIKSFSDAWDNAPTPAIPMVTNPYVADADPSRAIARGELTYHGFFRCWNCHPAYISDQKIGAAQTALGGVAQKTYRPNLHQAAVKTDSEGQTIFAPDFLRDPVKSGTSVNDIYRTVAAGITGTAMPSWIDAAAQGPVDKQGNVLITQADIWAVAYYVQDLIKRRTLRFKPGEIVLRDNRKLEFSQRGMAYVAKVQQEQEEEFLDEDED